MATSSRRGRTTAKGGPSSRHWHLRREHRRALKQGLDAEQIVEEKPPLTPVQVYAALAYYFANRKNIDTDLIAQDEEYDRMEAEQREARARGDWSLG